MQKKENNNNPTKWSDKQIMNYLEENYDAFEVLVSILYEKGVDQEATVGFSSREHQANYYFNEMRRCLDTCDYPKKVNLVYDLYSLVRENESNEDELKEFVANLKQHGYEDNCSLVWIDDDGNGDEYYFYSNKKDAEVQFNYLKESEAPFIKDEISKFEASIKESLNYGIYVKVKSECGDPYYTYNIYDGDVLIVDGAYDLDESTKTDVIDYIQFKKYLESQNLYLDSIEKQTDMFTRYYIVSIGMYGKHDTVDKEIPMDGKAFAKGYYQGVKRNLVSVFKDFVDMEDLMQQFKDID